MKTKSSIQQLIDFIEYHKFSSAIRLSSEDIVKEAERLKNVHRKEIENAWTAGCFDIEGNPEQTGTDYFNETFEI